MIPKNNPATEAAKERKFKKKVLSSTSNTIRRGATTPSKTRRKPIRITVLGCKLIFPFTEQPAACQVTRFCRFKLRRIFLITQPIHHFGAARVESTSLGWINQAGRLSRRHILEGVGIFRIWFRSAFQQGICIGVQMIVQNPIDRGFLNQLTRIHYKYALRKITNRRKIMGDVNHCQVVGLL